MPQPSGAEPTDTWMRAQQFPPPPPAALGRYGRAGMDLWSEPAGVEGPMSVVATWRVDIQIHTFLGENSKC